MAIRFVTKPKPKPEVEAKTPPAPKEAGGKKFSLKGKPAPSATWTVGEFKIQKGMSFAGGVSGNAHKFLVHRTKPGVWYEVVSFDEYADRPLLKLRSPNGLVFESSPDITTPQKYVVVVGPADAASPSEAVMQQVRLVGV